MLILHNVKLMQAIYKYENYRKIMDVFWRLNLLGPAFLLVSFSFNSVLKLSLTSWNLNSLLWSIYKFFSFPTYSFLYLNWPWLYCLTIKIFPRFLKTNKQTNSDVASYIKPFLSTPFRIKHIFFLDLIELFMPICQHIALLICVWVIG